MLVIRPMVAVVVACVFAACDASPSPSPAQSADGTGSLVVILAYQDPPPGTPISIGGYGVFADLRGHTGLLAEDIELPFPCPLELWPGAVAGEYRLTVRVRPASDANVNGVRDFGPVATTCDSFISVAAAGPTSVVVTVVAGESCSIARPNAGLVTTLTPTSAGGVGIGVRTPFEMLHCGINSPVDFDGSFWDPVPPVREHLAFDNATGIIRLVAADAAVFVSSTGHQLRLTRHAREKVFLLCE